MSKDEYKKSEASFLSIHEADGDIDTMDKCLDDGRVYLQVSFRQEDPSTHVLKMQAFWMMPYGPVLLSKQFEWLVDGSVDGDLVMSIQDNLECVLDMTVKILSDKKGDVWSNKLMEIERESQAKHGNSVMKSVFIIRELAKSWGNAPEKLIFIQGEDDIKDISDQPYIYIVKVARNAEADYPESLVITVKVGNTTIFEDVNLCVGLAAVIQLCFVFNLMFPKEADDVFNYVQRCLAKFGPPSGARNAKGQVKKKFLDFQCAVADALVLQKKGVVEKMWV